MMKRQSACCRKFLHLALFLVVLFCGRASGALFPNVAHAPPCEGEKVSVTGSSAEITYPAMDDETRLKEQQGATVVYPSMDTCFWSVATGGTVIRITFERFDVEWSPGCVKDRLEIYQGDIELRANMLSVFCGTLHSNTTKSQDFLTPNGNLLLKFVSDAPYVRTGFKLKFDVVSYVSGDGSDYLPVPPVPVPAPRPIEPETLFPTPVQIAAENDRVNAPETLLSVTKPVPKCNGRLDMLQAEEADAYIQSPNFGFGAYHPNDKCYWLIAAQPNKRIHLTFEAFHVGDTGSVCADDSVTIYSGVSTGAGLLGKFCGNDRPPAMSTPGRLALVVFTSNAFRHFNGFRIKYKSVQADGNSPLDSLPLDRQNVIQNLRVDINSPGSADLVPGAVDTRCNGRVLVLRADASLHTIQSPNFANGKYFSNDNCTWRIWTDPGLTIRVTISSFNVEAPPAGARDPDSDACPYDYLNIYDGHLSDKGALLAHLCGTSENVGKTFYSRTSRLLVTFKSDSTNEFSGFVLNFQVQDKTPPPAILAPSLGQQAQPGAAVCGGEISTMLALETEQYVNSPNYGVASYTPNDRCYWVLKADPGMILEISLVDLELDGALPTCNGDSLKVYDDAIDVANENAYQASLLAIMCGPLRLLSSKTVRSTTNAATVVFLSDRVTQYAGFRLSFKQTSPNPPEVSTRPPLANFAAPSPCRGRINTLTADEFRTGSFTSPSYGTGTASDTCAWLLSAPGNQHSGERVRLIIEDFDLGPTGANHACSENYIQVFDGSSPAAPELGKFCGDFYYHQIISSGAALYIQYLAGPRSIGRGFKATFRAEAGALSNIALAHTQEPDIVTTPEPSPKCNGVGYKLMANDRDWSTVFMPMLPWNASTYSPSDSCKWQIEAPLGFIVKVRFPKFHLESPLERTGHASPGAGDDCPDYVEIYDGEDYSRPNTTRIGRFCGNTPPESQLGQTEIKTTQRFAVVRFASDAKNEWGGFSLQYRAIRVPGTPTGPQPNPNFQLRGRCSDQTFAIAAVETVQILHSPNFDFGGYQAGDSCTWVLVAPRTDQRIQMVFTIMDIPGDGNSCLGSYVSIKDGSSTSSPLLGQFCSGNYPERRPIYSTSQAVTVQFKADWRTWLPSSSGKGFQMGFGTVDN